MSHSVIVLMFRVYKKGISASYAAGDAHAQHHAVVGELWMKSTSSEEQGVNAEVMFGRLKDKEHDNGNRNRLEEGRLL